MLGTVLSASHALSHLILMTTSEVGIVFTPVLQLRKPRLRDIK